MKKSIPTGDSRVSYPSALNGLYIIEVRNNEINYHQKVIIF